MQNRNKFLMGILAFAVIASLVWGFRERGSKNSAWADLDKEKLKNESLLSEKLSIEKERDRSATKAREAKDHSDHLTRELEILQSKLEENTRSLQGLKKENAESKKKYNHLLIERAELTEKLTAITAQKENLERTNGLMNDEARTLRAENQKLQEDLRMARLTRYDKPLLKATRGSSNKLVVKASRVQKLTATLSVSNEVDNLKFTVINPAGTALTEKEGSVTSRIIDTTATSKNLEITFSPKKKLQPGLYQIEVVSGETHVGSLQVSLR